MTTHQLNPDGTPIPHLGEGVILHAPPGWPTTEGRPVMAFVTGHSADGVSLTAKWPGSAWNDLDRVKHGSLPGQWRTLEEWEDEG